jgi:hypothetical protein
MKIYLISQGVNDDYDTYDSAVVCADNEEEARGMNPSGGQEVTDNKDIDGTPYFSAWCFLKDVKAEYLGEAKEGSEKGVICASFNAG